MLTKPCERSFAGAQDDSGRFKGTVVGSGGQRGVDENRYEQKKDRERAGGKTVMLSGGKHLLHQN